MKKIILNFIAVVSIFFISDVKAASPTIYVDGTKTNIEGEIIDGRTFVSLKSLCETLNCKFGYKNKEDKANKLVTIYTNIDRQIVDDTTASTAVIEIQYKINSDVYQPYVTIKFEDIENKLKLKPIKEVESVVKGDVSQIPYFGTKGSGDLYVPIRFISNGLGRKVEWDGATRSIYIDVAKPVNYEHLLVTEKIKFGDKVNETKISNEVDLKKCLTAIASENKIVSNNSTLLSFVGANADQKDDKNYKISNLYTESKDQQYYGFFANICSLKNTDETTKIVSITTPNYYPYIQVHNIYTNNNADNDSDGNVEENDNQDELTKEVETPRNLINVPIDSRPVSRSNFSNLVTAAGYNYLEVSDGITDYVNNDIANSWSLGNSVATRTQLENLVSNNNVKDTSVIINTSSYIFGGLGATRSPYLYNDLSSLSQLQDLVTTYAEPTYYITAVLPRVLPETRIDDWSWPIKVGGLKYYLNGENNESFKIGYTEALVEWYYLKYMNEATNSYNEWPAGVKKFYDNFFKWYAGGEKSEWEYQTYNSNVVKPWEYENMYKQFYELYKQLINIQNVSNSEITILMDDYELPPFIVSNQNKYNWIPKDVNGQAIKYSVAYDVLQKIEKDVTNKSRDKVNLVYGTDEINHLILARDIVKNNTTKIDLNVNYSSSSLKNFVGYYDKLSVENLIDKQTNFINHYGSNNLDTINLYMVRSNDNGITNASRLVENIYSLVNNDKNVMVTDISDNKVKAKFMNNLINKNEQSIFQIPYYGGWNTVANALGISLSSITVQTDLKNDVDLCIKEKRCTDTLTADLERRLIAYDKAKMVSILEDGVYSGTVKSTLKSSSNSINLDYNGILNGLTNPNVPLKIGKYKYYYDSASYVAYNPWPRVFEVKVEPNLGNLVYR